MNVDKNRAQSGRHYDAVRFCRSALTPLELVGGYDRVIDRRSFFGTARNPAGSRCGSKSVTQPRFVRSMVAIVGKQRAVRATGV